MTDSDKLKIKPLTELADYALWRIRIEAACSSKGLEDALDRTKVTDDDEFKKKQRQASNIIVTALSDAPLRIVRKLIGSPHKMLAKLYARSDSNSTASKI